MSLIPDKALGTKVKKQLKPQQTVEPECPKHKVSMEFYCKSCEKQVCAKCLLKDHKPNKHNIVPACDIAKNLSGKLQKLENLLKYYKKEENHLEEKILQGIGHHEQDKNRLEQEIKITLEREQRKLKKAAENLLNELNKKIEGQAGTFAGLKMKHTNLQALSTQIHENCTDLHQNLQQLHLSQSSSEIEQVSKRIETLKDATELLKTACKSTPTNVGFNFTAGNTWQLGKLTKVSSKPMILNSADFANIDGNVNTQNPGKDKSCKINHDRHNQLGSHLDMSHEVGEDYDPDGWLAPHFQDCESTDRYGDARCDDQNRNDENHPCNEFDEEPRSQACLDNSPFQNCLQPWESYDDPRGSSLRNLQLVDDDEEEYLEESGDDAYDDGDNLLEEDYADQYGHLDGNLPVV